MESDVGKLRLVSGEGDLGSETIHTEKENNTPKQEEDCDKLLLVSQIKTEKLDTSADIVEPLHAEPSEVEKLRMILEEEDVRNDRATVEDKEHIPQLEATSPQQLLSVDHIKTEKLTDEKTEEIDETEAIVVESAHPEKFSKGSGYIMDYGELLYKAQENDKNKPDQAVRVYKTTFSPPKKLQRPTVSSENIKKFLAKKELEEKIKLLEEKKKKEKLLALRSQDRKAQKRVQVMLKRTKSANKSVMEDAVDNNNTADILSGSIQCDEDDYGYVSQEATAFYNKLMMKYSNAVPEKSPFSKNKKEVKDLGAAKDRVKAALQKEADDAELPHKRKKRKNSSDAQMSDSCDTPEEPKSREDAKEAKNKEHVKKKIRNEAPPPPSFQQLLKLAEEKQHQPIVIENKSPVKTIEVRPMTKKEKAEYIRELERRQNRERQEKGLPLIKLTETSDGKLRVEKVSTEQTSTKTVNSPSSRTSKPGLASSQRKVEESSQLKKDRIPLKARPSPSESTRKIPEVSYKPTPISSINSSKDGDKSRPDGKMKKPSIVPNKDKKTSIKPKEVRNPKIASIDASISDIDREIELLRKKKMLLKSSVAASPCTSVPPARSPLNNNRASTAHKKDFKERSGKNSPPLRSNVTRTPIVGTERPCPLSKKKKAPTRRIESDSEYDSELDDFIADDDETEDVSKYISEIFGYDRNKYRNVDDDECMESNFAQQEREEFISAKIGLLEDLEDIRKEAEEKKRKAKIKKK